MTTTKEIDMSKPVLYRHDDAVEIRNATPEELAASIEAAKHDGGVGVILVDGQRCYVQE
jgi:predicted  nucleic acid-binding Zn-ribbon protein